MSELMKSPEKITAFKLSDGSIVHDEIIANAQQRVLNLKEMLSQDNFGVSTDDGWWDIEASDVDVFLKRNRDFILAYLK